MLLPDTLIRAEFVKRLNRFSALVKVQGRTVKAYLPNSGRMKELLLQGARIYLCPASSQGRLTAYDFLLVKSGKTLVSVDSRIPNRLLEEYFRAGTLPGFEKYRLVRREVKYGHSRFDFLLERKKKLCYVEAKSVTLNRNRVALFPDAPTERGRQHLEELIKARLQGHQSCIIFVAQRSDSLSFSPNDDTDPEFGKTLWQAIASGVKARAYRCKVTLHDIQILGEIPVNIQCTN